MKKVYLFFMTFFLASSVSLAQNIDSFTVSNTNPKLCDTVELINLSTNYTSLQWAIEKGDFDNLTGYPCCPKTKIMPKDTGCYSIALIVGRGNDYDTIRSSCAFHVAFSSLIALKGNVVDTIKVFENYIDPGYNLLSPECLNTDTFYVKGTVNTEKIGTYTIKYYVQLQNGWTDSAERTVYVKDRDDLFIQLISEVDTIEVHHSYNTPDFFVYDKHCGDSALIIHSDNNIDTARLGKYHVRFWVENCPGRFSDTVIQTVYVLDLTPPIITVRNCKMFYDIYRFDTLKVNPVDSAEVIDNYDSFVKLEVSGTYYSDFLKTHQVGLYTIQFDARDSSGNNAKPYFIFVMAGIISIDETDEITISLFPNPSNGQFTLELGEAQIADYIRIFDVSGKLIMHIDQPQQKNEIQLPRHCKGIYIVQVGTKKGIYNTRIFVN